jgi:hypothetical protein
VQDAEGLELLLIGHVTMSFPKDIETAGEFIARISLSGTEKAKDGSPKIKVYNVWAVRDERLFHYQFSPS